MRVTRSHINLPSVERGDPVTLRIDGRDVHAFEGETVLGVMMAEGQRVLRHTAKKDGPRGMFCGIGVCYECLVTVDGVPNTRACHTLVAEGMVVETRSGGQHG